MQNQFCCYSFSGWYSSPLSPVISWNLSSMVSDPHRHMSVRHTSGLHFTALQSSFNLEVRWGTSDDFTTSFLHFLCFLSSSGYNESSRHILHAEQPSRGTLNLSRTVFASVSSSSFSSSSSSLLSFIHDQWSKNRPLLTLVFEGAKREGDCCFQREVTPVSDGVSEKRAVFKPPDTRFASVYDVKHQEM